MAEEPPRTPDRKPKQKYFLTEKKKESPWAFLRMPETPHKVYEGTGEATPPKKIFKDPRQLETRTMFKQAWLTFPYVMRGKVVGDGFWDFVLGLCADYGIDSID